MPIYDAAMRYKREGVPLVVFGGKEYGMGSSRDWAAKGTCLLGVKAVIAESFERIHRSNLVGMGVLPLTFKEGMDRKTLGITGEEMIDILGLEKLRAAHGTDARDPSRRRQDRPGHGDVPRRYGRTRSSTTATAASCTTCCAEWRRRPDRPGARHAPSIGEEMPKGSDLLVRALENEGVDRIFGVPGEENLDVVDSLRQSSIKLIITRHEQAAAFMAATHGRLTGKPGVCIATLGPGRSTSPPALLTPISALCRW